MRNLYYTKQEALEAALAFYHPFDLELSSADCEKLELEGDKAKQRLSPCCGEVNCYRVKMNDDIFAWWCESESDDEEE